MSVQVIEVPPTADMQEAGQNWLAMASQQQVTCQEDLDAAGRLLKSIKEVRAQIVQRLDPAVQNAHRAHKAMTNLRNELDAPFARAEQIVKERVGTFVERERRNAEAAARKAEEEARKQQDEERLARAEQLAAQGRLAEAGAEIEAPSIVQAVPVDVPKTLGVATKETWRARVDSPLLLVRYISEHPQFINLVSVNLPALNDLARSHKEHLAIPGVVSVRETTVAVR